MKIKTTLTALAIALSTTVQADVQIAVGKLHTLINDNGQLYSAGDNRYGALGQQLTLTKAIDEQSVSTPNVIDMDAGLAHSAIVTDTGNVYIFGYKINETPQLVEGIENVEKVEINQYGAFVLKSDGTVYAGWSTDGSTWTDIGLVDIVSIAARGRHFLALDSQGNVYGYGDNRYGQLGTGDILSKDTPELISTISNVDDIIVAHKHSIFVKGGEIYMAGYNGQYQLGFADGVNRLVPEKVPGVSNVASIDGGNNHTVYTDTSGKVYASGWHNYIGDGKYNTNKEFVQIPDFTYATSVRSGMDGIYVVQNEEVYAWGGNLYGKLALGHETETHNPDMSFLSAYEPPVVEEEPISETLPVIEIVEEVIVEEEVIVITLPEVDEDCAPDHNKGHGNDCDGYDEDNPGKSQGSNGKGLGKGKNK